MTGNDAPPRESVWTKYSPNHEFPLASAASLLIHGLLLTAVVLSGLALNRRWYGETSRPPSLDVGYVKAGPGDGLPVGGGGPGTPDAPTEAVDAKQPTKGAAATTPVVVPLDPIAPPMPMTPRIEIPVFGEPAKSPDLAKAFAGIEKEIGAAAKANGTGSRGAGGQGTGTGTGVGPGSGPGKGTGGAASSATRAEALAQRWRFSPSGSPRDHVQKLIAAGVKVGFKDGNDQFWMIRDLKKRPVEFQLEPFDKYRDTVKWYSVDPRSILGMAVELQMSGPPQHFVLLLPADREQKLADAEFEYAKARNRAVSRIDETWFDFQLVGGSYEPRVVAQVPFDQRPKW